MKFLMEFDLVGAEWVVVAYLANDSNMIGVVKSGKSPHVVTGSLISGAEEAFVMAEHKAVGSNTDPDTIGSLRKPLEVPPGIFLPRTMSIRQAGKKANHGLNYGMKYKKFALLNEIAESEAALMVEAYTTVAYPGLEKGFWGPTRDEMKRNDRSLVNCFGRKVRLLDEWGPELWNQAYSFKPQSTVVDSVNEAMCRVFENTTDLFNRVEILSQTHDSLLIGYTLEEPDAAIGEVVRIIALDYMRPEITYSGQTFRLDTEMKVGFNWGDMKGVPLTGTPQEVGAAVREALMSLLPSASTPPYSHPPDQASPSQESPSSDMSLPPSS